MNRLLVIKPSSLGDIVHGLQVVQCAVRRRPELRVTWVVRERFAGLVQAAPFVHEVVIFRRRDGWRGFVKLLWELRRHRFDVVWDLQGLLRSGLMVAAARAPLKIGRDDAREGARLFYNRRVLGPNGPPPHHALDILRPFLHSVQVDPDEGAGPLELGPDKPFAWQSFFATEAPATFVVFTDSRGAKKTWPHFQQLMQQLFAAVPDCRIAWCAGQRGEPDFTPPPGRFLNLSGCPLDEMIALVRQPAIFIGNDSGPMHLSAACGNRVLAIFGPTSPERFGPYPPGSSRYRIVVAPRGDLGALAAADVLAAVRELLARAGSQVATDV